MGELPFRDVLQDVFDFPEERGEEVGCHLLFVVGEQLHRHVRLNVEEAQHVRRFREEGDALLDERSFLFEHLVFGRRRELLRDERADAFAEFLERDLPHPLSLQPVELLGIEHRPGLLHAVEREGGDQFIEREELLRGAGVPSEEREEVHERLREVALLDVLLHGHGVLPLT